MTQPTWTELTAFISGRDELTDDMVETLMRMAKEADINAKIMAREADSDVLALLRDLAKPHGCIVENRSDRLVQLAARARNILSRATNVGKS